MKFLVLLLGVAVLAMAGLFILGGSGNPARMEVAPPPKVTEPRVRPSPLPMDSPQPPRPSKESSLVGGALSSSPAAINTPPVLPGEPQPVSPARIERARRELASAPDDPTRVEILQRVAEEHLSKEDYAWARQIVEECADLIQAAGAREHVDQLLADLRRQEGEEKARIAGVQKGIRRERHEAIVQHLKDRLEEARRDKRSPEDIQSIEDTLRKLEKDGSTPR